MGALWHNMLNPPTSTGRITTHDTITLLYGRVSYSFQIKSFVVVLLRRNESALESFLAAHGTDTKVARFINHFPSYIYKIIRYTISIMITMMYIITSSPPATTTEQ